MPWTDFRLATLTICLAAASPGNAAATKPDLSSLSLSCQGAYKAMTACLQKTLDAGAPESIRAPWEKQIADSVQMWRAMRGQPGVEQSCREIAAKPDCAD